MSTTNQPSSSRQEIHLLLQDIFAVSKDRLASFDLAFEPAQQEMIKTYKRAVYDAFVQNNTQVLFGALEILLTELEKFELSYLQRSKEHLQAEMDSRVKQALDALQHNTTAPSLEGVNVDAGLNVGSQTAEPVLPYEKRRAQIMRLHALTHHIRKNEAMQCIEIVTIATCMGIMSLYLLNLLTTGPILWYTVVGVALVGLLSSAWNWRSVV